MRSDDPVQVGYRCVGCGLAFVAAAAGAATCPRCQSIGGHERVPGVGAGADARSGADARVEVASRGAVADSPKRADAPTPFGGTRSPAEHASPVDEGRPVADGGPRRRDVRSHRAAADPPTRRCPSADDD